MSASRDGTVKRGDRPIVLNAGCGNYTDPRPPDLPFAWVVGLDIDADALAANHRLDERIVGDLETTLLDPGRFDVVICTDVLEHLNHPLAAVDNLIPALRPGGELRISIPSLASPKALVAKFTPHWFHVMVYRRIFRIAEAGQPGHPPFPVKLRWQMRPASLVRHLRARGFVVSVTFVESGVMRSTRLRYPRLFGLLERIWVFGDPRATECEIVAKKRLSADSPSEIGRLPN